MVLANPYMQRSILLVLLLSCTQPSDSSSQKLEGAFLNALIYVLIITAVTFGIVLLFKYGVGESAALC
jgi:hypothetical protein